MLDNVGLSNEMRRFGAELASKQELVLTLTEPLIAATSVHIFGSRSECSTIPGTKADIDVVTIHPDTRLVTNVADCHDSDGFLLIPDTHPGYARLQALVKGQPVTKENVDLKQRIPTVCTASSRNCIFQNLTFLKDLMKNITMSPFCIPKVLKSATKSLKIG